MGDKLLDGIKSMYLGSLAYFRVKGKENERFSIDSGVGQWCIMFPWLFNVYMDAVMDEVKMGMGRRGESGDGLASCMQILGYVWRIRGTEGYGGTIC